jgi:hypothetical protein
MYSVFEQHQEVCTVQLFVWALTITLLTRPKFDSRYGRWNSCLHYQVHNISRVNRTSYTEVQLLFHHWGRGSDSHSLPSLRRHQSVVHIGLAIPVLGLLSAQTCKPQRQRPVCVAQSGQPSIHILFLVEPRMEQITNLSTTKGLCCTLLTIWRLYVHSTTNKHTQTHTHTHTNARHVFRNFVQNINGVSARVTRVYRTLPLLCCEKQIWTRTPKESTDRKNSQQS